MNLSIKKMNNYLLDKNSKVILSLIFLIFILILSYVFFLFMSVSYTYASKNDSLRLNDLVFENVKNKMILFRGEKEVEKKLLNSKFVKLDKINYVSNSNKLVLNLNR